MNDNRSSIFQQEFKDISICHFKKRGFVSNEQKCMFKVFCHNSFNQGIFSSYEEDESYSNESSNHLQGDRTSH